MAEHVTRGGAAKLVPLAAAVLLGGLAACSSQSAASHPDIEVSAPMALADQSITMTVTGLAPGQHITVSAQAVDDAHQTWGAQASYTASPAGVVNLTSATPAAGSYQSADGMGLFWSMNALGGQDNEYFYPPAPQTQPDFRVRLTVTSNGRTIASSVVTRDWLARGETARALTAKADGVSGVLFLPPPGTPRHPAVLVFGGAEGGMNYTYTAALLAARGYPALTVAYFDWPGRPSLLQGIPLEYFTKAARILAAQPGVDPAHLLVMGYSRGSEAALLLADHFPQLFHGAIVYSPSSDVNPAQADTTQAAWTLHGKPVWPAPIPVNHVDGPVIAIAGDSDALWNSEGSAAQISAELGLAGSPYPHRDVIYLNAGHGVGTFPYLPIGDAALAVLGGTRAGDVAAQRSGWALVLHQLAMLG
jgi:dienelactone hydrolase